MAVPRASIPNFNALRSQTTSGLVYDDHQPYDKHILYLGGLESFSYFPTVANVVLDRLTTDILI